MKKNQIKVITVGVPPSSGATLFSEILVNIQQMKISEKSNLGIQQLNKKVK